MPYSAPERPTLYFIGVTTGGSSIMRVFPAWAAHLGLGDVGIVGMDFPPHAPAEEYRAAVRFIRDQPLARGALVTTHKLDLFAACQDLFDHVDAHAALLRETSCLSKRDGRFVAHAKDTATSALALRALLGDGHFARTGAEALLMGAGGAAIAISWNLLHAGAAAPRRIVVTDRDATRLEHIAALHRHLDHAVPVEYHQVTDRAGNDAALRALPAGSLVVNATGMGKDTPGSPLTDAALFPKGAVAWDLNYRGDLLFLAQARAQAASQGVRAEDGWVYFIHGWTQAIAEIFGVTIPSEGAGFDAISEIARSAGRA